MSLKDATSSSTQQQASTSAQLRKHNLPQSLKVTTIVAEAHLQRWTSRHVLERVAVVIRSDALFLCSDQDMVVQRHIPIAMISSISYYPFTQKLRITVSGEHDVLLCVVKRRRQSNHGEGRSSSSSEVEEKELQKLERATTVSAFEIVQEDDLAVFNGTDRDPLAALAARTRRATLRSSKAARQGTSALVQDLDFPAAESEENDDEDGDEHDPTMMLMTSKTLELVAEGLEKALCMYEEKCNTAWTSHHAATLNPMEKQRSLSKFSRDCGGSSSHYRTINNVLLPTAPTATALKSSSSRFSSSSKIAMPGVHVMVRWWSTIQVIEQELNRALENAREGVSSEAASEEPPRSHIWHADDDIAPVHCHLQKSIDYVPIEERLELRRRGSKKLLAMPRLTVEFWDGCASLPPPAVSIEALPPSLQELLRGELVVMKGSVTAHKLPSSRRLLSQRGSILGDYSDSAEIPMMLVATPLQMMFCVDTTDDESVAQDFGRVLCCFSIASIHSISVHADQWPPRRMEVRFMGCGALPSVIDFSIEEPRGTLAPSGDKTAGQPLPTKSVVTLNVAIVAEFVARLAAREGTMVRITQYHPPAQSSAAERIESAAQAHFAAQQKQTKTDLSDMLLETTTGFINKARNFSPKRTIEAIEDIKLAVAIPEAALTFSNTIIQSSEKLSHTLINSSEKLRSAGTSVLKTLQSGVHEVVTLATTGRRSGADGKEEVSEMAVKGGFDKALQKKGGAQDGSAFFRVPITGRAAKQAELMELQSAKVSNRSMRGSMVRNLSFGGVATFGGSKLAPGTQKAAAPNSSGAIGIRRALPTITNINDYCKPVTLLRKALDDGGVRKVLLARYVVRVAPEAPRRSAAAEHAPRIIALVEHFSGADQRLIITDRKFVVRASIPYGALVRLDSFADDVLQLYFSNTHPSYVGDRSGSSIGVFGKSDADSVEMVTFVLDEKKHASQSDHPALRLVDIISVLRESLNFKADVNTHETFSPFRALATSFLSATDKVAAGSKAKQDSGSALEGVGSAADTAAKLPNDTVASLAVPPHFALPSDFRPPVTSVPPSIFSETSSSASGGTFSVARHSDEILWFKKVQRLASNKTTWLDRYFVITAPVASQASVFDDNDDDGVDETVAQTSPRRRSSSMYRRQRTGLRPPEIQLFLLDDKMMIHRRVDGKSILSFHCLRGDPITPQTVCEAMPSCGVVVDIAVQGERRLIMRFPMDEKESVVLQRDLSKSTFSTQLWSSRVPPVPYRCNPLVDREIPFVFLPAFHLAAILRRYLWFAFDETYDEGRYVSNDGAEVIAAVKAANSKPDAKRSSTVKLAWGFDPNEVVFMNRSKSMSRLDYFATPQRVVAPRSIPSVSSRETLLVAEVTIEAISDEPSPPSNPTHEGANNTSTPQQPSTPVAACGLAQNALKVETVMEELQSRREIHQAFSSSLAALSDMFFGETLNIRSQPRALPSKGDGFDSCFNELVESQDGERELIEKEWFSFWVTALDEIWVESVMCRMWHCWGALSYLCATSSRFLELLRDAESESIVVKSLFPLIDEQRPAIDVDLAAAAESTEIDKTLEAVFVVERALLTELVADGNESDLHAKLMLESENLCAAEATSRASVDAAAALDMAQVYASYVVALEAIGRSMLVTESIISDLMLSHEALRRRVDDLAALEVDDRVSINAEAVSSMRALQWLQLTSLECIGRASLEELVESQRHSDRNVALEIACRLKIDAESDGAMQELLLQCVWDASCLQQNQSETMLTAFYQSVGTLELSASVVVTTLAVRDLWESLWLQSALRTILREALQCCIDEEEIRRVTEHEVSETAACAALCFWKETIRVMCEEQAGRQELESLSHLRWCDSVMEPITRILEIDVVAAACWEDLRGNANRVLREATSREFELFLNSIASEEMIEFAAMCATCIVERDLLDVVAAEADARVVLRAEAELCTEQLMCSVAACLQWHCLTDLSNKCLQDFYTSGACELLHLIGAELMTSTFEALTVAHGVSEAALDFASQHAIFLDDLIAQSHDVVNKFSAQCDFLTFAWECKIEELDAEDVSRQLMFKTFCVGVAELSDRQTMVYREVLRRCATIDEPVMRFRLQVVWAEDLKELQDSCIVSEEEILCRSELAFYENREWSGCVLLHDMLLEMMKLSQCICHEEAAAWVEALQEPLLRAEMQREELLGFELLDQMQLCSIALHSKDAAFATEVRQLELIFLAMVREPLDRYEIERCLDVERRLIGSKSAKDKIIVASLRRLVEEEANPRSVLEDDEECSRILLCEIVTEACFREYATRTALASDWLTSLSQHFDAFGVAAMQLAAKEYLMLCHSALIPQWEALREVVEPEVAARKLLIQENHFAREVITHIYEPLDRIVIEEVLECLAADERLERDSIAGRMESSKRKALMSVYIRQKHEQQIYELMVKQEQHFHTQVDIEEASIRLRLIDDFDRTARVLRSIERLPMEESRLRFENVEWEERRLRDRHSQAFFAIKRTLQACDVFCAAEREQRDRIERDGLLSIRFWELPFHWLLQVFRQRNVTAQVEETERAKLVQFAAEHRRLAFQRQVMGEMERDRIQMTRHRQAEEYEREMVFSLGRRESLPVIVGAGAGAGAMPSVCAVSPISVVPSLPAVPSAEPVAPVSSPPLSFAAAAHAVALASTRPLRVSSDKSASRGQNILPDGTEAKIRIKAGRSFFVLRVFSEELLKLIVRLGRADMKRMASSTNEMMMMCQCQCDRFRDLLHILPRSLYDALGQCTLHDVSPQSIAAVEVRSTSFRWVPLPWTVMFHEWVVKNVEPVDQADSL